MSRAHGLKALAAGHSRSLSTSGSKSWAASFRVTPPGEVREARDARRLAIRAEVDRLYPKKDKPTF